MLQPGTILDNKYQIEAVIGQGGFGHVYRARERLTGETVAIKELVPSFVDDQQMVQRFILEARATLRLSHPGIARTHTIFDDRGTFYLAMEYLPGGSLADLLKRGPLPVEPAVRIAIGLCEALAYAHALGVVHCDIKPANVLFDDRRRVRLADFGIAHFSAELMSRQLFTATGAAMGTLRYMAPEQLEGVRDDPRVDIYALGALLYEMVSGQPYLDFETESTPAAQMRNMHRIQGRPPRPLRAINPDAPEWLVAIVHQALSKAPQERYSSVEELGNALRGDARQREDQGFLAAAARSSSGGLVLATGDNVARLLQMPRAPERVWWEKAEMELRFVPAGDFRMGSPPGEGAADEHPTHTVHLDAYYIGRYPVTNAQYAAFVRETGHHPPDSWDGEKAPEGEQNHPVVGVSSGDAVAFCDWADLCLPTEAQWEKAARGNDGRRYPWGDHEPTEELCNFSENEGGTTPVGKYSPQGDSPYGCTDMAGNVWELCADWYREDYYRHSPPVNPTGPSDGSFRVLRGGAWFGVASYVRCCVRFWYDPVGTWSSAGFRCARNPG